MATFQALCAAPEVTAAGIESSLIAVIHALSDTSAEGGALVPTDMLAPALLLIGGLLVALTAALHSLTIRTARDTEAMQADAEKDMAAMRRDQKEHQLNMGDLKDEARFQAEECDAAEAVLRKYKSRCARRVAFVRHVKAVNATFVDEYDAMVDSVSHPAVVAAAEEASSASASSCNSSFSVAAGEQEAAAANETEDGASPTPQSTSASTARGSPRIATSGPSPPATYDAVKTFDAGVYAEDEMMTVGDIVVEARANAQEAVMERDDALAYLHELEGENADLQAELKATLEAQLRFVKTATAEMTAMHRESQQVDRDIADVVDADEAAEEEELATASPARQAQLPEAELEEERFALLASDVDDMTAHCSQLRKSNAYLTAAVTAAHQELEELLIMGDEQAQTIAGMRAVLMDDQLDRDAEAAAEAEDDVMSEEERRLGSHDRADDDATEEAASEEAVVRGASLGEEAEWLAEYIDDASEELQGAMAELRRATMVLYQSEAADRIEHEEVAIFGPAAVAAVMTSPHAAEAIMSPSRAMFGAIDANVVAARKSATPARVSAWAHIDGSAPEMVY
jgi:hypothetical protein